MMRFELSRSGRAVAAVLMIAVAASLPGCSGDQPVSSSDSGLRPADEDGNSGSTPSDQGGEDQPDGGPANGGAVDVDGGPGAPPAQPPAAGAASLKVPAGGDAKKLVAFLDQMEGRLQSRVEDLQGAGLGPEASEVVLSELKEIMRARIDAARQLLAAEAATPEQREEAVDVTLDGYGFLEQIGEPAAEQQREFVTSIKDHPQPAVRRRASLLLLEDEIDAFAAGDAEAEPMITRLRDLLADQDQELSGQFFRSSQSAANALFTAKKMDEGLSMLRLTAERFGASDDERIVAAARQLSEQAGFVELDWRQKQLQDDEPMSVEAFLQTVEKLLSAEAPGMQTLMMISHFAKTLDDKHAAARDQVSAMVGEKVDAMLAAEEVGVDTMFQLAQFATQAEYSGDLATAERLHTGLLAAADKAGQSQEVDEIREQVAEAKLRVGLVGQPLDVTGVLPDGTAFDWEKYRGKVVLVDFWATWCRPCLQEIPNIEANYEQYKDQGFEVIGVNLDDDVETLNGFLERRELLWPSIISEDPAARGFKSPMAQKCGVSAIPFVLLIGKDGKVLDIHVRGERLGEELAELFGPAAPDEAPGVEKPDAETPDAADTDPDKPAAEEPAAEEPAAEEPDAEEPDAEEPDAEEPDAEEPAAEEPAAEEPAAEEPADESAEEAGAVETPATDAPPAG